MVEARHARMTNDTGHIMPKGSVRQSDCLDEGYHSISPGQTVCVASPNYPSYYPNRADSQWEIDNADDSGTLSVECTYFKLQRSRGCRSDSLSVMYDGFMEKYCGRNSPGDFEVPSYWMTFHFTSNGRRRYKGFICYVTAQGSSYSTAP